jgi:putative heme-binding domain-containing protein
LPDWKRLKPAQIAAQLESPNAWVRDTAQRLLNQKPAPEARRVLARIAVSGPRPESRVAALHTAFSTGTLERRTIDRALRDASPHVREQAALLIGQTLAASATNASHALNAQSIRWARALADRTRDLSPRVQLSAALALAHIDDPNLREPALERFVRSSSNSWHRLAAVSSTRRPHNDWLPAPVVRPARPAPQPIVASPDRDQVIERFRPALALPGDPKHGAAITRQLCLACHYLHGHGQRIGPDLAGLSTQPPEKLLGSILNPSREVAPDHVAYTVKTRDGRSLTGLLASRTDTRIVLRFPGSADTSIAEADVISLESQGRSLMPDGLENDLTIQDFADLLAFLRAPDSALLLGPDEK